MAFIPLTGLLISAAVTAGTTGLEYLLSKNRKQQPVDRGKTDDIRLSIPGYGESIIRAWGTFRVAPVWIWHKPIVHSTITTPGGGGGKGQPRPPTPTTVDHIYTTSLAGVLCEGPITDVTRIWFDTDLVYNTTSAVSPTRYEAEAGTLAGGANSVASSACSGGFRVQGIGSGGSVQFAVTVSATGNYEMAVYYTAASALTFKYRINGGSTTDLACTSTGGTNIVGIAIATVALTSGANTIKFENAGAATPDLDKIELVTIPDFQPPVFEDPRSFTGLLDPNMIPPNAQSYSWSYYMHRPSVANSTLTTNLGKYGQPTIRIYTGTETQPQDPAIVADKGVANTPQYKGVAYLVIDGIQVPGGRIPNVTVEVNQGSTGASTITTDIYGLVGVTSGNLSLSALAGDTLTGFMVTSRKAALDAIAELQTRFQFDLIEVDGVVKAVKRNGASDLTIPYSELRAHLDGEEMPAWDAVITDVDPLLLPTRVDLGYLDPALDYHNNTQSEMRLVGPQQDNQTVSLSIVDSADNMKKLAAVLLYKPELEGRGFKISTGPKYARVHPGSVLTLTLPNATHVMRVTEAHYGLPGGVCEFEGVRQQPSIYSPTGSGSVGTGYEVPIAPIPANSQGIILDSTLLRGEDAGDGTQPVIYVGECGRGSGAWPGGFLYQEYPIGSDNYRFVTSFDREAGIGETYISAMAIPPDPTAWDRNTSLGVQFYSNTSLATVSEQDLLANPTLNLLGIRNQNNEVEYIQAAFVNPSAATPPFKVAYALGTLLRARLGTNALLVNTGSLVAVIDNNIKPRRMELTDIGRDLKFKFVSSGQAEEDAATYTHTLIGSSLRPLAPVNIRGFRDATGNLLIEWTRRSRLAPGVRPSADVPVGEESEYFEVEIYSGSTLVRTARVRVTDSQPVTWSVFSGSEGAAPTISADGSLTFTSAGTDFVTVRADQLIRSDAVFEFTAPSTGYIPFVYIERIGAVAGEGIFFWNRYPVDLSKVYAESNSASLVSVAAGDRFSIRYYGGSAFYYKNYSGPLSAPVLVTTNPNLFSPPFAIKVAHAAGAGLTTGFLKPRLLRLTPDYLYTADQQVTDFGSTQASIKVRIYQISAIVGRGFYTEATI